MTRNEQIIALRETGLSYQKIAKQFNLNHERIRQICKDHAEKLRDIEFWKGIGRPMELGWIVRVYGERNCKDRRILNCLRNEGIENYEYNILGTVDLLKLPNLGKKSFDRLYDLIAIAYKQPTKGD